MKKNQRFRTVFLVREGIRKEQSDGIAERACLHAKAERQHQGGSRGISRVRCVFTTLIHRNTKEKPHVFVRFFWWEEVDS